MISLEDNSEPGAVAMNGEISVIAAEREEENLEVDTRVLEEELRIECLPNLLILTCCTISL